MDKKTELAEQIFLMFLKKYSKEIDVTDLNLWSEVFNEEEDKDLMLDNMIKTAKDLADLFYKS